MLIIHDYFSLKETVFSSVKICITLLFYSILYKGFISYTVLIFMIGRFSVSGDLQLSCECIIHQNSVKSRNVIRAETQIGSLNSTLMLNNIFFF